MRLTKLAPLLLAVMPLVLAKDCKAGQESCKREILRQDCKNGNWHAYDFCDDDTEICVVENGKAVCAMLAGKLDPDKPLERREPSLPERYDARELCPVKATRCHDNIPQLCSAANTWTNQEECAASQMCVEDCGTLGCQASCRTIKNPDFAYPPCVPGMRKCDYPLGLVLSCNKHKQWETDEICPKGGDCKPGEVGEARCERTELPPLKPTLPGYAKPSSVSSSSDAPLLSTSSSTPSSSTPSSSAPSSSAPSSSASSSSSSSSVSSSSSSSSASSSSASSSASSSSASSTVPEKAVSILPIFGATTSAPGVTASWIFSTATTSMGTIPGPPDPPQTPSLVPSQSRGNTTMITTTTTLSSTTLASGSSSMNPDTSPHGPDPPTPYSSSSAASSTPSSSMPASSKPSSTTRSFPKSTRISSTLTSSISVAPNKPDASARPKDPSLKEHCDRPGIDRCVGDKIQECVYMNGFGFWYDVVTCPSGSICWADIDEKSGSVIGNCDYPNPTRLARRVVAEQCDRPGNQRCNGDKVQECVYTNGIGSWHDVTICAAGSICWADIDEASGSVIATCNALDLRRAAEPCNNTGSDRCHFDDPGDDRDYIQKCLRRFGVQAWYDINICPTGTFCYEDAGSNGTMIGSCRRPDNLPEPIPGRCRAGEHVCDENNYALRVCNKKQEWVTEMKCTTPGDCKIDGPGRAHCERGGMYPPKSARAISTTRRAAPPPPPILLFSNCTEAQGGDEACVLDAAHNLSGIAFCSLNRTTDTYNWMYFGPCKKDQVCDLNPDSLLPECKYPLEMPNKPVFCEPQDKICGGANNTALYKCNNEQKRWDIDLICTEGGACVEDSYLRAHCSRGGVQPLPPGHDHPKVPGMCNLWDKKCSDDKMYVMGCNTTTLTHTWYNELACTGQCVPSSNITAYCEKGGAPLRPPLKRFVLPPVD